MIGKLVQPVREVNRVIGAVAQGVLSENVQLEFEGRPLKGEFLKNAITINTMLDQLNSFSSEVTRVARGEEGFGLARRIQPDAITLDLGLPDCEGWDQFPGNQARRRPFPGCPVVLVRSAS